MLAYVKYNNFKCVSHLYTLVGWIFILPFDCLSLKSTVWFHFLEVFPVLCILAIDQNQIEPSSNFPTASNFLFQLLLPTSFCSRLGWDQANYSCLAKLWLARCSWEIKLFSVGVFHSGDAENGKWHSLFVCSVITKQKSSKLLKLHPCMQKQNFHNWLYKRVMTFYTKIID